MLLTSLHSLGRGLLLTLALVFAATVALPEAQAQNKSGASAKKAQPTAKANRANASPRKGVRQAAPARKGRAVRKAAPRKVVRRAVPSVGQLTGLHATDDPLDLRSSVALVVDQQTNEVLFSKNPEAVLPIASITKLMTALVVTEAGLPLDEELTVSDEDVRGTLGSGIRSKLRPGTRLSRGELMHLSLMASENRAAHVLGRTYPGGLRAFVRAMNRKADELGMGDTRYVEPTGLSADNRSSATDLARLVKAASQHPVIGQLSTSHEAVIPLGSRPQPVQFRNTNGLVHNPEWSIGLQKTGFISAAGRCVVMQAEMAGRQLIMVLLDSAGRYSRMGDAERLRKWLAEQKLLASWGFKPAKPVETVEAVAPAAAPTKAEPARLPEPVPLPALDPAKPIVQVPALPLTIEGRSGLGALPQAVPPLQSLQPVQPR
jgi:serine-type D-Ala-D-Ala endopeptidase (penicillin-binding protein 7)